MLYIKQSVRVANTETFPPQKRGVPPGSTRKFFIDLPSLACGRYEGDEHPLKRLEALCAGCVMLDNASTTVANCLEYIQLFGKWESYRQE